MDNNNNKTKSAEINDVWISELFKKKKPVFLTQTEKKLPQALRPTNLVQLLNFG